MELGPHLLNLCLLLNYYVICLNLLKNFQIKHIAHDSVDFEGELFDWIGDVSSETVDSIRRGYVSLDKRKQKKTIIEPKNIYNRHKILFTYLRA